MNPSETSKPALILFRFSLLLCFAILFLILAGGLVTSHEAGLAVPDWPLSYGQLMPPMVGNVFWEHGHRMIAGTVGILTLIFAIWIQLQEKRAWMKKLGWIALAAVVTQAILGGITVKMMLPPAVSIFHACLAQTFFCLIVSMAYFLSPRFLSEKSYSQVFSKPTLFYLTTGFIYLQLILGAVVRHTHQGIVFHVINALFVLVHILRTNTRIMNYYQTDPLMTRLGTALSFGVLIQIFLGFGAFIFTHMLERGYAPHKGEVVFTAAHQTTGAVLLVVSVLICVVASPRSKNG